MGVTMRFSCVLCPRGCWLEVGPGPSGAPAVSGQGCARGAEYGLREAVDPRRILTTTLATAFPDRPRLSVKSSGELPRARLVEAARSLDSALVATRARRGDVLVRDLLGLGVDMVATDDLTVGDGGLE